MTKLTYPKIRWIMKELDKGELSVGQIASVYHVTPRRVRQLREFTKKNGYIFKPSKGRPNRRKPFTEGEVKAVLELYQKYRSGATKLEQMADSYGIHVPHNRIQNILNIIGKSKRLDKKIRRKKWVRYERRHSNTMWHTDWTQLGDKYIIAYEDDASRLITGYGIFDHATVENSIAVLKKAISIYGKPKSMLTGRDTQFYNSQKGEGVPTKNGFQVFLEENGIKHILARVNHPQTNGKMERWFGTMKSKLNEFEDLDKFVTWYNEIVPHMSLDETPAQAFVRKKHYKVKNKELVVNETQ